MDRLPNFKCIIGVGGYFTGRRSALNVAKAAEMVPILALIA
jgi:hypothetical protein